MNIIKNVSSSTSHKKNPSLRPYVIKRIYEPTLPLLLSPLYVSSSQPVSLKKGGGRFPLLRFDETQIFLKIKRDLMRPVLCYGEVLRFFKTSQSFDQITTLTYVLMDNFLSFFYIIEKKKKSKIFKWALSLHRYSI